MTAIEEVVDVADQVMLMAINPGWGGQTLIPSMIDKLRRLRAMLDARGVSPDVEVDGGVKTGNIGACVIDPQGGSAQSANGVLGTVYGHPFQFKAGPDEKTILDREVSSEWPVGLKI